MKFLRRLLITAIILAGVGYGVYHFGTKFLADKVVEQVDVHLSNSETLASLKEQIEQNPEIKQFVEEGASIPEETLPFSTKEEAVEVIVKKLNISDIKEITSSIQDGITQEEQHALMRKAENTLTAEELNALKVVLYNEVINTK